MVLVDSSTTCGVCLRPIGGESALATHGRLAFPRGHKLCRYNDKIYHYTCFFALPDREQLSVQMVLESIAYLSQNDSWQVFYQDSHCFAATNPDLQQIQLEIFSNAAHIRLDFSNYLTLVPSLSHAAANESVQQALDLIRKSFPSIQAIVARCDLVGMRRTRVQRRISERHALYLRISALLILRALAAYS